MMVSNALSRRKKVVTCAFTWIMLVATFSGVLTANVATANPMIGSKPLYYKIDVFSPQNGTLAGENTTLKLIVKTNNVVPNKAYCFTIDGSGELLVGDWWDRLLKVQENVISQVVISDDPLEYNGGYFDPYLETTSECIAELPQLPVGEHKITVYHGPNYSNPTNGYWPRYSFIFSVVNPPGVHAETLTDHADASREVLLDLSVSTMSNSLSWVGYSVDGQSNVTVNINGLSETPFSIVPSFVLWRGNLTVSGLSDGVHEVVFYAMDIWGNTGASIPVSLQLTATPAPTPTPKASPTVTESPVPSYKPIPVIAPSLDPADYEETNTTQGATFQQTLTVLSTAAIQIQIPLSLKLTGYNNSAYASSAPQEEIFNYTFNPNVLDLNPDENQSSILTVEVADDAPLGKYVLNVELGNASLTHLGGYTFFVNVASSQLNPIPSPSLTASPTVEFLSQTNLILIVALSAFLIAAAAAIAILEHKTKSNGKQELKT